VTDHLQSAWSAGDAAAAAGHRPAVWAARSAAKLALGSPSAFETSAALARTAHGDHREAHWQLVQILELL